MTTKTEKSQIWGNRAPRSICDCGHSGDGENSQHADSIASGHGPCRFCDCDSFFWAKFTDVFLAFVNKA